MSKIKGKKGVDTFVRYGGLSLVKQDGYNPEMPTYHCPPANKGVYAFPLKCIDFFLCAHRKNFLEERKEFTYKKELWHHLGERCKPEDIIERKGTWVLTEFSVWSKAYSKESINLRYGEKRESGWDLSTNSINEPLRSGVSGMYSIDHFEVFIDQKIG